jgi:hypothetical protein
MAHQYDDEIHQSRLQVVADALGTQPVLRVFAAPLPPTTRDPDPAGLLVTLPLKGRWAFTHNKIELKGGPWAAKPLARGKARSFRLLNGNRVILQGLASDLQLTENITTTKDFVLFRFHVTAGSERPPEPPKQHQPLHRTLERDNI